MMIYLMVVDGYEWLLPSGKLLVPGQAGGGSFPKINDL